MKSSLSSRLDLIRKSVGPNRCPAEDSPKAAGDNRKEASISQANKKLTNEIPGWIKKSEYVFFRQKTVTLPQYPSAILYPSPDTQKNRLCFFDTETTGLSSGAGTVIFLAGTGRIEKNGLQIRQYFLSDYPGERDFLELLLNDLTEDSVYVTYNGKAFDFSLLKSRLLMNGLRREFSGQIDLLHPMRRLMKTVRPSCSQKDCEEAFLGHQRKNDIPGSLVPFLYRKFLDASDASILLPVFSHHFFDIQNLALLFFWLQDILREPEKKRICNSFELARILLGCDPEKGISFMRDLASQGNVGAKFAVSMMLKRNKETDKAAVLWDELAVEAHFHALIELAKYAEHKKKDLRLARRYSQKALGCTGLSCGQKKACQIRLDRLREKSEK